MGRQMLFVTGLAVAALALWAGVSRTGQADASKSSERAWMVTGPAPELDTMTCRTVVAPTPTAPKLTGFGPFMTFR